MNHARSLAFVRCLPLAAVAGGMLLPAACGVDERADGPVTAGAGSATGDATAGPGSETDTSATAGGTGGPTSAGTSATAGASTSAGGPKFDVGLPDGGGAGCEGGDGNCGCSFVDLLFVIDNSGSMGGYQEALSLAFPQFVDTLVQALPTGTNVHVGVTSTEMGYSSQGSTSITNGQCTFMGEGGQSEDAFYITPDVMNTGRNGAQGRLYKPGGNGAAFAQFDTDGPAADLDQAKQWFAQAAQIGEGGSNIEMSTAPAGWATDPVNDPTNAGFLRDEGAVFVVFFMQDEPDQTPLTVNGMETGQLMLDKITAAKAGCGGLSCVIAGGFLNDNQCGGRPIDTFLAGIPTPPTVTNLPPENLAETDPQAAAAQMNQLLADTLANVIAQKCDEIPPVG